MKFELGPLRGAVRRRAGRASAARRPTAPWRARRRARRSSCSRTTGRCRCATTCASIAVIGPNADSARNLLGDYAHIAHIETLLEMRDEPDRLPGPRRPQPVRRARRAPTILDAIRERCAGGAEVRFAAGGGVLDADDAEIAAAVEAARGADVAIVVVGERSGLTLECTCGEMRDRMELGLPGRQEELVAAVAATGTPVVLVLVAGRPLAIPAAAAALRPPSSTRGCRAMRGRRDRRGPLRRRRPGRQAPGHRAPPRRPGPDLLRAQALGRALALARRLRRRLAPAAVALRPRALVHALRAARPRARPHERSRPATRWRSASRSRTSASARATRSSSSTCATRRRASRARSRSCAASGACAWRPASAAA